MKNSLLPLLFLFAQSALSAEEALTKCRQIENIEERVACYDEIVDSQYRENSNESVATSLLSESTESRPIPDAQSLFGAPDAEAKRIVETTLAIEQISQIEAIVTDVRKSANRKLAITLDNGQIWRQLDNQRMRLKVGEKVVISKASLGSFLMEKQSGSRRIRVRRVNSLQ